MTNGNESCARDYIDMIEKVEELRLTIEETDCADRNDLYKLIFYKQQLKYWLNEKQLEETLKSDIQRFSAYISNILNKIDKDEDKLEEIKSNALKIKQKKILEPNQFKQFISTIFLKRVCKVIITIIALIMFHKLINVLASNSIVQGMLTVSQESNIDTMVSTFKIIANIVAVMMITTNIGQLALDTIYVTLTEQKTVGFSMLSNELQDLIMEKGSTNKNTIDYCKRAEGYWLELKQYMDKLNSSKVTINDKRHVKTFNESKDKLTKQIDSVKAKINNEKYIIQIEGLADAELVHRHVFM